jgi:fimbrial chaperone protein
MPAAIFKKLGLLGVLALMLVATPSSALLVQPVFLDMRYTGVQSNGGIRVVNDRNRPVSVEVTVSSLEIPEKGQAVFTPIEGEDFLIFPAVANIPPNGTQIFRIRWVGDPAQAEGKMFAFTTSELPIAIEETSGAAVQLLYAIQTVVAIGPSGTRAEIAPIAIRRGELSDGAKGVIITFENTGALHGQVNSSTITVSAPGGWSRRMEPADVSNAVGLGLVPANAKREMFLALPDVPEAGELTVTADIPSAPLV